MHFAKLRKQYLTMMEVLIALSLTIILMTTLTYFYSQIDTLSRASEKLQKKGFHTRYAENRLTQVFANTIPDFNFKQTNLARAFCFFTSGDLHGFLSPGNPSLVFMYNNQARADSDDADVVQARLFVDKNGRLILASWPPAYEWEPGNYPPAKLEILMEDVTQMEFEFFVTPKSNDKNKDTGPLQGAIREREHVYQTLEPPTSPTSWVSEWNKEYNKLPPMIKIFIRQKDMYSEGKFVDTQFAFPLPYSRDLIIYES